MIQRKLIEPEEYKRLQVRAKKISLALMKKEDKNYAKVTFPIQNYRKVSIDNQDFYYAGTNIFLGIIEEVLFEAKRQFPKNFGNGNAVSVVHALNKTRFLHSRLKDAIRIYGNENFIWVYDNLDDGEENKILRLDLYRKIDKIPRKKRKWTFTGGLFHALKHFSMNGKPLSTGTDINDVINPEHVIYLITKAFFTEVGTFDKKGETCMVFMNLDSKYNLKFIFYYEKVTSVYFIKTIYKEKKTTASSRLA
ncbi:hypothetical protein [Flavobacterium microcysteis]|uniref:Uncharacterized protein n=1 Tax=Flavobacterium microcysteis TaxID=2596891 RepID=A0A501QGN5_9FLAO|nr:hypothetical protein [Flavobacterium microcysteis]TPD71271.1 hypothetical protein FJA49_05055 [Flavobacterium microcysteis]